jgi:hypothetical protein
VCMISISRVLVSTAPYITLKICSVAMFVIHKIYGNVSYVVCLYVYGLPSHTISELQWFIGSQRQTESLICILRGHHVVLYSKKTFAKVALFPSMYYPTRCQLFTSNSDVALTSLFLRLMCQYY